MKKILLLLSACLMLPLSSQAGKQPARTTIIPEPVKIVELEGNHELEGTIRIYSAESELKDLARTFIGSMTKTYAPGRTELETGFTRIVSKTQLPSMKLAGKAKKADVILTTDKSLAKEGYTLDIRTERIEIKGGSPAGVWWGLQSLAQLLIQNAEEDENEIVLPALHIEDQPHFAYRGAMLDCGRHFFSVDDVKTFIDIMAIHKLNVLHWHLTEDQGWRIEIRKYPKLTEIGSIRKETLIGHYNRSKEYDGKPYGGFYTQDELKEIVAYAAARQIDVIPEIDLPGHCVAALASYPEYGCTGGPYEVRTLWGISNDVLCLGNPGTIQFIKDILDEVCEIFPSSYFHLGGDECPTEKWEACPKCQAKAKELGYDNVKYLQSYMLHEVEDYLAEKGKRLIGWDEILERGVTKSATVMSWRGAKGGIAAAKQGNEVIMSPNSYFYFDYYQSGDAKKNHEPLAIGGNLPLEKCLSFNPYDQLGEKEKKYIIGVQANTWTEYMPNMDHVQHMNLPRMSALSTIGWSESHKDYPGFLEDVKASLLPVYQYFGFIYAPYAFE